MYLDLKDIGMIAISFNTIVIIPFVDLFNN